MCQPPGSPDLSPLDYYFWAHLKGGLEQCETRLDLRLGIQRRYAQLQSSTKETLDTIVESFYRRLLRCIHAQGGHFEVS